MTEKGAYNAYKQASQAVGEVQQVVMLYEGAINLIEQAKAAIVEKDYEKRYNLINRAISIVTGLNSCLNFEEDTKGVSKALDEYYQSLDMRLLYIQCDNSIESCNEVIRDLKIMLDAWSDIARDVSNNPDGVGMSNVDEVDIDSSKESDFPDTKLPTSTEDTIDVEISV